MIRAPLDELESLVGGDHVVTSKMMFAIKNAIGNLPPRKYMIEVATNIQSISFPPCGSERKACCNMHVQQKLGNFKKAAKFHLKYPYWTNDEIIPFQFDSIKFNFLTRRYQYISTT
jgi:hypothetical protein